VASNDPSKGFQQVPSYQEKALKIKRKSSIWFPMVALEAGVTWGYICGVCNFSKFEIPQNASH
jgi:hypothetical protein